MSDIFISYSRDDQTDAKALAEALETAGWSVWWDQHLRAGEQYHDIIERQIKGAKCIIVLWSRKSTRSQYVKDEANYALDLKKLLIPVSIDDATPPFRFHGLHTLMLGGWGGSQRFPEFQKLLADIANKVGPPVAGAAATEPAPIDDLGQGRPDPSPAPPVRRISENTEDAQDGLLAKIRSATSVLRTTATYGQEFERRESPDQYAFKVYVGGFSGSKTADERAKVEIDQFMKKEGYTASEILKRTYNFLPSYYEYVVKFRRG